MDFGEIEPILCARQFNDVIPTEAEIQPADRRDLRDRPLSPTMTRSRDFANRHIYADSAKLGHSLFPRVHISG
jgi:hypothetical protein